MKKLLIALSVLASTQFASATGTSITKIKDMYTYDNFIVVKMANRHSNSDSCTYAKANEYLYLATNTEGGKKMYSAVLSAFVAGKKIRFGYHGCASWGSTTIPKAYGVSMFN